MRKACTRQVLVIRKRWGYTSHMSRHYSRCLVHGSTGATGLRSRVWLLLPLEGHETHSHAGQGLRALLATVVQEVVVFDLTKRGKARGCPRGVKPDTDGRPQGKGLFGLEEDPARGDIARDAMANAMLWRLDLDYAEGLES